MFRIRKDGVAIENEEYIEGVVAFAIPINAQRQDLQAAIWAVGLKHQVRPENIPGINEFLKKIAAEINLRFARTDIPQTVWKN